MASDAWKSLFCCGSSGAENHGQFTPKPGWENRTCGMCEEFASNVLIFQHNLRSPFHTSFNSVFFPPQLGALASSMGEYATSIATYIIAIADDIYINRRSRRRKKKGLRTDISQALPSKCAAHSPRKTTQSDFPITNCSATTATAATVHPCASQPCPHVVYSLPEELYVLNWRSLGDCPYSNTSA